MVHMIAPKEEEVCGVVFRVFDIGRIGVLGQCKSNTERGHNSVGVRWG